MSPSSLDISLIIIWCRLQVLMSLCVTPADWSLICCNSRQTEQVSSLPLRESKVFKNFSIFVVGSSPVPSLSLSKNGPHASGLFRFCGPPCFWELPLAHKLCYVVPTCFVLFMFLPSIPCVFNKILFWGRIWCSRLPQNLFLESSAPGLA